RAARHFDAIQARAGFRAAGADGPHLAGRQWISLDRLVAMELRSRNELFDPVGSEREAEMRVPEFALEAALLLFLDSPARFERNPDHPLEVLVGDLHRWIREEELRQATEGLVNSLDVTPAQRTAEV